MNDLWVSDPKVGEAMTKDYGWVMQSTALEKVVDQMLVNNWEEVLVSDESHNLIGLITKEHLVSRLAAGFPKNLSIKEICCSDLITTNPNEDLAKARDVMRQYRIGRLPVINDEGDAVGMLTAKDVCNGFSTKLEKQGEQLCAVMENIAEAIQVIDCDGVVSFWNNGAERLFGIKGTDIVGKNLNDILPDDLPLQVLKTSKPYRNVVGELSGGVYVVRNAVPVKTPNGLITGVVCTTADVSHLKALMEKLDEANHRVKSLERFMIGKDPANDTAFYTIDQQTLRLLGQARRVARTDATVMIQGPSGTGKELLANLICSHSKRADQPLIEVNCSAIPDTLFESEMFGYEAGAFTGGNRAGKAGKFEIANGATIFLDEVGELPLDMQAKLLRVIQERRFYRVGGTSPIDVDVRLIAATNRDLAKLVAEGGFREDLYYRLNVVTFEIPPLKKRKCDIPGLVDRILRKLSLLYENNIKGVDKEVMDLFTEHDWPGNVRQLQNILENIAILMQGDVVTIKTLAEVGVLEQLTGHKKLSVRSSPKTVIEPHEDNLDKIVEQSEREAILNALRYCSHNKSSAAKLLGIPRSTLYYKIKALGIQDNHINLY